MFADIVSMEPRAKRAPVRRALCSSLFFGLALLAGCGGGGGGSSSVPSGGIPTTAPTAGVSPVPTPAPTVPAGNALAGAYTDPKYLTMVPFGNHSHWIQPWRSSLETMPVTQLTNGIGVNFSAAVTNPNVEAEMLAKYGFRSVRFEFGWGTFVYAQPASNPPQIATNASVYGVLAALKAWGLRPTILLNANSGVPCPSVLFSRTVTANAAAGATSVQLNSTSGLIVGYSGLSNLTGYVAAEAIVTSISGNTVTLSKPLPAAIASGTSVPMATLQYRPFSYPAAGSAPSSDYTTTLNGWKAYVHAVATIAQSVMGTGNFDLEIWNELTFDSQYLDINNYYSPALISHSTDSNYPNDVFAAIVSATAAEVAANPALYSGVGLSDGFANTIPWPASSIEPPQITGIGKHPYAGPRTFPPDSQSGALNALFAADSYTPSYTEVFPEYFGTVLQTETLLRDASPLTTSIYGTQHGRYARSSASPVWVWITEVNNEPSELGVTNVATGLALKAKEALRYYVFYLNKGAAKVDIYTTFDSSDLGFGTLLTSFLSYVNMSSTYPSPDTPFVSPAAAAVSHLVGRMSAEGVDPSLTLNTTRKFTVVSVTDRHNHAQFTGDGSPAHPSLYDREVLAILPYQENGTTFKIPYYVMTRDFRTTLAPEQFVVTLSGVNGSTSAIDAYDPIADTTVPVVVYTRTATTVTLGLTAADYPYVLTIHEGAGPQGLRRMRK